MACEMNNVITSVGVLTLGVVCAKKSASSCILKNCNCQSGVAPRYFEGTYLATFIFVSKEDYRERFILDACKAGHRKARRVYANGEAFSFQESCQMSGNR
jgi:hypothetical protein